MATVAEQAWLDAITRLGCCVCLREGLGASDAEPHHILGPNRHRIDHLHTIPLCFTHHRANLNRPLAVSRHPWGREFEARYGTEAELLEWCREQIPLDKQKTGLA